MKNKIVYNACFGGYDLSNQAIKILKEDYNILFDNDYEYNSLSRHDSRLVEVVEKLGNLASSDCSKLKIAEIDGDKYRISEYDGIESVQQPEDIDWVTIIENEL